MGLTTNCIIFTAKLKRIWFCLGFVFLAGSDSELDVYVEDSKQSVPIAVRIESVSVYLYSNKSMYFLRFHDYSLAYISQITYLKTK